MAAASIDDFPGAQEQRLIDDGRLAEAGATPHEIMSVTGHKTLAEVERYTEKVRRAGLADRAMQLLTGDSPK